MGVGGTDDQGLFILRPSSLPGAQPRSNLTWQLGLLRFARNDNEKALLRRPFFVSNVGPCCYNPVFPRLKGHQPAIGPVPPDPEDDAPAIPLSQPQELDEYVWVEARTTTTYVRAKMATSAGRSTATLFRLTFMRSISCGVSAVKLVSPQ